MTDPENKFLQATPEEEGEIDLINFTKEIWSSRRLVIKTTIVFIFLGLIIALLTPTEYSVSSIMVPQSSNSTQSKLGSLSSLAAMAGFNLNLNNGSELSPMIYPQIVQSVPFQKALMQTKLDFKGIKHPVTYYDYFTKYSKPSVLGFIFGFPGKILRIFHKKQQANNEIVNTDYPVLLSLTPEERALSKKLANDVYANIDANKGYITLTAIMPQALAAAELGQQAQELLQQFITEIKIKKAQAQLNFIRGRYEAKKKAYDQAQMALAQFQDQNKNLSTATAASEQARLTNNYQLAFGVYSQLAQELENAQIQVKDETPVFSVIEPVTIPNTRFKPKRKRIVILWTFLGVVVGVGMVFGKKYWSEMKEKWYEENKKL